MEISEILDAVDILEYISQYCELEERQDGEYWGCSPLKEENTPSFSVNQDEQVFYDFSTGYGGNVVDFITRYHHCSVSTAFELLKKYANLSDEETAHQAPKRLLATKIAKKFKPSPRKNRESKAEILPENYMSRYENDREKLLLWEREGISKETMERFQVRYDPFSERIVYPIRDVNGNIINVSGRTLDPDYKAKGQRKYTYFKPLGTLDTIYGLAENMPYILEKQELILFEGAKSVMQADGWGIKNTGAILTSHLNYNQFRILIKLGVTVVFALDAEIDIRKDPNIMKLRPYVNVEWVLNRRKLLGDKDSPTDKGEEVFKTLYEERWRLR